MILSNAVGRMESLTDFSRMDMDLRLHSDWRGMLRRGSFLNTLLQKYSRRDQLDFGEILMSERKALDLVSLPLDKMRRSLES